MRNLFVLTVLCGIVACSTALELPAVTCPKLFQYLSNGINFIGHITLTLQQGVNELSVQFSQRYPIQSDYVGSLSLFDDEETTKANLRNGRPISYRVDFPTPGVLPKLTMIQLNGNVICTGREYPPPNTIISLTHMLSSSTYVVTGPFANSFPEDNNHFKYNERPRPQVTVWRRPTHTSFNPQRFPDISNTDYPDNSNTRFADINNHRFPNINNQRYPDTNNQRYPDANNQRFPDTNNQRFADTNNQSFPDPFVTAAKTVHPTPEPTSAPTAAPTQTQTVQVPPTELEGASVSISGNRSRPALNGVCGRESNTIVPFIHFGNVVARGQFPWLTAIYQKLGDGLKFICGGSLISRRTVLTAAHCFKISGVSANRVLIYLGRHNLDDYSENGIAAREVASLVTHPDYNTNSYPDADVALVHLQLSIEFTQYIQPICLWSERYDLVLPVGQKGYVAGWGDDESGATITSVPKMVDATIVDEAECLRKLEVKDLTSNRTLCAGNRDGSGPCMGDSGGGLMINYNSVWVLRGVVSAGQVQGQRCDLREYVIYCDIAKHITWVRDNMLD